MRVLSELIGLVRQIVAIDWAARRRARRSDRAERKRVADHEAMLEHVKATLDKLPDPKAKRK